MSIQKVEVDNAVEVDQLLQILVSAVKDAKSGKAPLVIAVELAPKIGAALLSISEVGNELKANPKAVEETIARGLADLVNAIATSSQAPAPAV